MTTTTQIETSGRLFVHPPAELIVEIRQSQLTGALKIRHEQQKFVVYFRSGEIAFAVANAKAFRFFNLILKKGRLDEKAIGKFQNFANDVEFSASLVASGLLTREEADATFVEQIESIIISLLSLETGEWVFSPLVRVRDSLNFPVDVSRLLLDYGRCSPQEMIFRRLGNLEESFISVNEDEPEHPLQADEAFIHKRLIGIPKTISELLSLSTTPREDLLKILYTLWLGGVLARSAWPAAFSNDTIGKMRTTTFAKVGEAADVSVSIKPAQNLDQPEAAEDDARQTARLPEIEIGVDEYLERVHSAKTHYDVMGLGADADTRTVKHAYFSLAKLFHPDRFHRESASRQQLIQSAFTSLAHAYETLKEKESREAYDAKMHKEIENRERRRAQGLSQEGSAGDRRAEQGLESFEQGINLLNDGEAESAIVHLSRAVHYSPQNAIFHAYYGKALSTDTKQKHKAESEFQTACRIDPKNGKIRLMLVDFLLEMNLVKRAEGELKRFLELVPGDRDATALLAKIQAA